MDRDPVGGPGAEHDRICAALAEMVAGRGYRSTSVDHVIEIAEVERAAFYRHFESIEDCFAAAWEKVNAGLSRRMEAAFRRREEWQDRLRDMLLAGLEYLAADLGRARLYVVDVAYVSDEMRDRQRDALAHLSSAIDLGRADAPEELRVSPQISDAISGAIWHRVNLLVQAGRGGELPAELAQFMYIAVLPYRGAEAARAELGRP